MKNTIQFCLYYPIFLIGYLQHKLFGKTNKYAYLSFRKLYGITRGKINKSFSHKISKGIGKYSMPPVTSGILGNFSQEKVTRIVKPDQRKRVLYL